MKKYLFVSLAFIAGLIADFIILTIKIMGAMILFFIMLAAGIFVIFICCETALRVQDDFSNTLNVNEDGVIEEEVFS